MEEVCDEDGDHTVFRDGAETCDAAKARDASVDCTIGVCDSTLDDCKNTSDDTFCDNSILCDSAEVCDSTIGCQDTADMSCDDREGCTFESELRSNYRGQRGVGRGHKLRFGDMELSIRYRDGDSQRQRRMLVHPQGHDLFTVIAPTAVWVRHRPTGATRRPRLLHDQHPGPLSDGGVKHFRLFSFSRARSLYFW
jgi:hypothetical protein